MARIKWAYLFYDPMFFLRESSSRGEAHQISAKQQLTSKYGHFTGDILHLGGRVSAGGIARPASPQHQKGSGSGSRSGRLAPPVIHEIRPDRWGHLHTTQSHNTVVAISLFSLHVNGSTMHRPRRAGSDRPRGLGFVLRDESVSPFITTESKVFFL
jgi:hypothetical protein